MEIEFRMDEKEGYKCIECKKPGAIVSLSIDHSEYYLCRECVEKLKYILNEI